MLDKAPEFKTGNSRSSIFKSIQSTNAFNFNSFRSSFHLFLYQIINQILFPEVSGSSFVFSILLICKSKNFGIVYDVVAVLSYNIISFHPEMLLVVVITVKAGGVHTNQAFIKYVFVVQAEIVQSCHKFVDLELFIISLFKNN
jgi:hypothetical protein